MEATETNDPLVLEKVTGQLAFWLQVEPDAKAARHLLDALTDYRRGLTTSIKLPDPKRVATIEDLHRRSIRDNLATTPS